MMSSADLRRLRERQGCSRRELAESLLETEQNVLAWETGQARIPHRVERLVRVMQRGQDGKEEVDRRLTAAGFGPCAWLEDAGKHTDLTLEGLREHAKSCPSCAARNRIADEFHAEQERARRTLMGRLQELWEILTF